MSRGGENMKLTGQELDSLARAYLDSRLTKQQEMELALVLSESDFSTPAIEEAKASMALEFGLKDSDQHKWERRPFGRKLRDLAASAACVAVLLGAVYVLTNHGGNADTAVIEVVVDGRRITESDEADLIADRMEEECMTLMRKTQELADRENERCRQLLDGLK